jgi:transposase-like protein
VPHANALLTELGRLRLARCVVEEGWSLRRAAERFQVSHNTAARWAHRYRQHGPAGMSDRSSRPHRSPRRTPAPVERRVLHLRVKKRWGPVRIGGRLGLVPATVYKVLIRHGVPRLAHLDRATGRPVRRYEKSTPGELVHVDVKKLGNIPDGGGWRVHGRKVGNRNNQRHPGAARTIHGNPVVGYSYLHGIKVKKTRPYRHKPTAKSSATTAHWPTNGPTPSPTPQKPPAAPPCPTGYTCTTITAATPHSAAHPPAASPTCVGRTPRPVRSPAVGRSRSARREYGLRQVRAPPGHRRAAGAHGRSSATTRQ